jgi:hypothetical protein
VIVPHPLPILVDTKCDFRPAHVRIYITGQNYTSRISLCLSLRILMPMSTDLSSVPLFYSNNLYSPTFTGWCLPGKLFNLGCRHFYEGCHRSLDQQTPMSYEGNTYRQIPYSYGVIIIYHVQYGHLGSQQNQPPIVVYCDV